MNQVCICKLTVQKKTCLYTMHDYMISTEIKSKLDGGNWWIVDWTDCYLTPTLAIFQLYCGLWIVFLIICTCSMCHIYWYETVRHYLPDLFHWHIHLFYTCNDLYYLWNKFWYLTCEISVFSCRYYFFITISVLLFMSLVVLRWIHTWL